jgi:hypothetical protein
MVDGASTGRLPPAPARLVSSLTLAGREPQRGRFTG